MKIKFIFNSIICLLILHSGYCQEYKRDNTWMLGYLAGPVPPFHEAGIDFNSGQADTFTVIREMTFFLTNAGICDTNGQLLFYTNGNYVSNRLHQMMPGTAGFNPGDHTTSSYPWGNAITQGAMIIPWPENPLQYVIIHMSSEDFTVNGWYYERPTSLMYSVIDMNLDSGLGDFTSIKNELLISDTLVNGRIAACKHANGRDWWIIAHETWSDQFYFFLMNPDTVYLHSSQHIGPVIIPQEDVIGSAVFTNDGNKLAYQTDSIITIYDFDRCTGTLSNALEIYFPDTLNLSLLSCSFSSSGRYLYACNNFHIFQIDMQAGDIAASKTIVATYDGFRTSHNFRTIFNQMKLAPDNKIYVSTAEGSYYFHEINDPDSAGILCDITQHSMILPSYLDALNALSMPNTPNYALGALTGSVCDSLSIGVNEIGDNAFGIIVFPNPANDKIYLKFNERYLFTKGEIRLYNVLGECVLTKLVHSQVDLLEISVHTLQQGIYSIVLISNENSESLGQISIIR